MDTAEIAAGRLRHGYGDTPLGAVHYAEVGTGRHIVLLHQTPRSHDEYRDLMPLLSTDHHVIAPDMPGFGASVKPPVPHTVEMFAGGVLALLDGLGIARAAVLGHHTGGAVALEIAARVPERVEALVLSSTSYIDEPYRLRNAVPPVDAIEPRADGRHLTELWDGRRPWYPAGHELLHRFVHDATAPGVDPAEGHRACARYRMEDRIGLVTAPTLLIGAELDPFALPELPRLSAELRNVSRLETAIVRGGQIPLMDTHAADVAALVSAFLAGLGPS